MEEIYLKPEKKNFSQTNFNNNGDFKPHVFTCTLIMQMSLKEIRGIYSVRKKAENKTK